MALLLLFRRIDLPGKGFSPAYYRNDYIVVKQRSQGSLQFLSHELAYACSCVGEIKNGNETVLLSQ